MYKNEEEKLLINNKSLMKEWDYEANKNLDPSKLTIYSETHANWICSKCGHKWKTQINIRQKHGCPKCGHLKTAIANARPKTGMSLADYFPELIKEWHPTKNGNLTPYDFAPNSNKYAWWVCSNCGYEWRSKIITRYKSKKLFCKKCNLKRAIRKPKLGRDLKTLFPKIANEWDYEKNYPLKPSEVFPYSEKEYYWKCENGHVWKETVKNRTKDGGRRCHECVKIYGKNKRAIKDSNNLANTNPELLTIWDYDKNKISPAEITFGSHDKVYWKCNLGHTYYAEIKSVVNGTRCPYCSNQKLLVGFNDLETWCKNNNKLYLLNEWDYEANKPLTPKDVLYGYTKQVMWKCKYGHSWPAKVSDRTKKNSTGCPFCANRKLKKGFNDLATVYPEIAKEWHPIKNGDLKPENVLYGSSQKVWWKCKYGHEWQACISSRIKGHFCEKCNSKNHVSIAEKTIVYYLNQAGVKVQENKKIGRKELDIFIPSMNVAIEYDGQRWHKNRKRDLEKNKMCANLGITLYRIREPLIGVLNDSSIDLLIDTITSDMSYLNKIINLLFNKLKINFNNIDIIRDLPKIRELINKKIKDNSIAITNPELVREWHPTKNGNLKPEYITKGEHIKVWWICPKCGKEYQAWVYSRSEGTGCKNCANKENGIKKSKAIKGVDDIMTTHPNIANEWDYEKNYPLTPQMVKAGSNKKVWWKCKNGHSFPRIIYNRTKRNDTCPQCKKTKQ